MRETSGVLTFMEDVLTGESVILYPLVMVDQLNISRVHMSFLDTMDLQKVLRLDQGMTDLLTKDFLVHKGHISYQVDLISCIKGNLATSYLLDNKDHLVVELLTFNIYKCMLQALHKDKVCAGIFIILMR